MQHHLYCVRFRVWKIKISKSDMGGYHVPSSLWKKQRDISMHQGDESMLVDRADGPELGKVDRLYMVAR